MLLQPYVSRQNTIRYKVDSKALYEAYEKESPFVDDRNQVLIRLSLDIIKQEK